MSEIKKPVITKDQSDSIEAFLEVGTKEELLTAKVHCCHFGDEYSGINTIAMCSRFWSGSLTLGMDGPKELRTRNCANRRWLAWKARSFTVREDVFTRHR